MLEHPVLMNAGFVRLSSEQPVHGIAEISTSEIAVLDRRLARVAEDLRVPHDRVGAVASQTCGTLGLRQTRGRRASGCSNVEA